MIFRFTPFLAALAAAPLAALIVTAPVFGQQAAIGWPEAVGRLAGERSKAEVCAGLFKSYAREAQLPQGALGYAAAKADFDEVITGLIVALSQGGDPKSLSTLETRLQSGEQQLQSFCKTAADLLPNDPDGKKGIVEDIVKAALQPVIDKLSEAIAALYNNHRGDAALTEATIKIQLEAAKWPDFSAIKAEK